MTINNNSQIYDLGYLQAAQAINRVSSNTNIPSSADDAASLAISDMLRLESNGVAQSIENTTSGIAAAQIGESALNNQSDILNDVRKKLLEASTDTTSQEGRESILKDIQGQLENLNNIASQTNYNGDSLLQANNEDMSESDGLVIQAGDTSDDTITTDGIQSNTTGLGLDNLLNQDSATFNADTARSYLNTIDNAQNTLSQYSSSFGSAINQLDSANTNLISQYTSELESYESLMGVDLAKEFENLNQANLQAQVGSYVQSQSNNINQNSVLRVLT